MTPGSMNASSLLVVSALALIASMLSGCASSGPEIVEETVELERYGARIVSLHLRNRNGDYYKFIGHNPTGSPICMRARVIGAKHPETHENHYWRTPVPPKSSTELSWWDPDDSSTRDVSYRIWLTNSKGQCEGRDD